MLPPLKRARVSSTSPMSRSSRRCLNQQLNAASAEMPYVNDAPINTVAVAACATMEASSCRTGHMAGSDSRVDSGYGGDTDVHERPSPKSTQQVDHQLPGCETFQHHRKVDCIADTLRGSSKPLTLSQRLPPRASQAVCGASSKQQPNGISFCRRQRGSKANPGETTHSVSPLEETVISNTRKVKAKSMAPAVTKSPGLLLPHISGRANAPHRIQGI